MMKTQTTINFKVTMLLNYLLLLDSIAFLLAPVYDHTQELELLFWAAEWISK